MLQTRATNAEGPLQLPDQVTLKTITTWFEDQVFTSCRPRRHERGIFRRKHNFVFISHPSCRAWQGTLQRLSITAGTQGPGSTHGGLNPRLTSCLWRQFWSLTERKIREGLRLDGRGANSTPALADPSCCPRHSPCRGVTWGLTGKVPQGKENCVLSHELVTQVTQELTGLMHHMVTHPLYPRTCVRVRVQQVRRARGSKSVSTLGANCWSWMIPICTSPAAQRSNSLNHSETSTAFPSLLLLVHATLSPGGPDACCPMHVPQHLRYLHT